MTTLSWTDQRYRGVTLNRCFKILEKRVKKYALSNNPEDEDRMNKCIYRMECLAAVMTNMAKSTELEQLKKEVAELKQTLYNARANTIPA